MKKLFITLLAACSLTSAKADEGMWTLYNLPNAVYETMKQENYQLPYGALYYGDDAVKNCVVNFGGYCSGLGNSSRYGFCSSVKNLRSNPFTYGLYSGENR